MSKELGDGGELRRAVAGLGRRSRTEAIPATIRAQVVAHARRERKEGRSWREVAESVGLAPYTVQRWVKIAEEAGAAAPRMVPVRVARQEGSPGDGLVLVMPSGVRLEGLGRDDAVAVLRALA